MLILFKGIKTDNVLIFDAEYNEGYLIQFAGILFKRVGKDVFQVSKSINTYIQLEENEKMNSFISRYTGITDNFLRSFGVPLDKGIELIEDFLQCEGTLLVASHGLHSDVITLENNNVHLYNEKTSGLCTYNMAKRILKRGSRLCLSDIAIDAGMFIQNGHNALDDTWATVAVFSLLCKLEQEKINEEI